jgi:quinol monooxygenase YgiN
MCFTRTSEVVWEEEEAALDARRAARAQVMPFCPVPHTARDQVWLAVGLAAGCAIGSALLKRKRPRASHPAVHVLLVRLKFLNAKQKEAWKAVWANAAYATFRDEPGCLSYEFCDAESDPLEAIIYERYVTRAHLDGPHQATLEKFKGRFGADLDALGKVDLTLTHFIESNLGHMDR